MGLRVNSEVTVNRTPEFFKRGETHLESDRVPSDSMSPPLDIDMTDNLPDDLLPCTFRFAEAQFHAEFFSNLEALIKTIGKGIALGPGARDALNRLLQETKRRKWHQCMLEGEALKHL